MESSPVCVVSLMSKSYKTAVTNFQTETPLTVIDCWRQLDVDKVNDNLKVVGLGRKFSE